MSLISQIRAIFTNGDLTRNTLSLLALLSDEVDILDKVVTVVVSTTTLTLSRELHHGKTLLFQNAAGCTVTVPNNLEPGFTCILIQDAAGQVTLSAGGGVSFLVTASEAAPYKTADQGSQLGLQQIDQTVRIAVGGNLA